MPCSWPPARFGSTWRCRPTLPPVLGDRTGLALMLDNLVDNVIRHSRGEHALAITASVAGRFVVLDVSDRGGGIPPDEVRHVTQKFYRGRLAGHGGTGLGLAIAARIVDDHRGTLKIDSEPGVGTTMRIAIPAAPVQPASTPQPRGGGRPVVSLRLRVLVVEDDHLLAKVVCDNLALDGFEVRRAADAHSAVNLVREFGPDLILLDVMLPDRSGFDLFETLHQGGRIPVIFLTARGETADKLRGLGLGADDYVIKPFDLAELLARVHAVLRRARGAVDRLTLGDVVIDFKSQTAVRGTETLRLTHREFELLRFLAARAGRVVHRGELLRGVWGYPDDSASTRSVDHAIARLRRKIEPQSDQPRFIHTVHGDGYSLTPGA